MSKINVKRLLLSGLIALTLIFGAGAIVGIVLGNVTVSAVGAFAIVWFVIKKKTWADLIAVFKKK